MAGADASIYGMIRPQATVRLEDPDEIRAKQMTLRNLMQQQEVGALGLQQTRQGIADDRSIADLIRAGTATEQSVGAINPKRGMEFGKSQLDRRKVEGDIGKTDAETNAKKLDMALKRLEIGGSILSRAKDQPSYDMALRVMADTLGPNSIEKMPPQFDPAYVQTSIQSAMTRAQQLADQRAQQGQSITMRGQDMTASTAAAGHAVTRRGQDMTEARAAATAAAPQRTYDAERGMVVDTRAGTAAPVTVGGAPLPAKDKPLTEFQSKGQLFGTRAAEADKIIADLSKKGDNFPGSIKATAGEVPLIGGALEAAINPLPGFMGGPSEAQQKVEQAQRNFINAVLRVESGAVISPSEFDNAQKQYFPKRGDTPGVIANKAANRKSAIEGLRITSGPAGPRVAEATAPTAVPTQADIDAELRRRKVIQ